MGVFRYSKEERVVLDSSLVLYFHGCEELDDNTEKSKIRSLIDHVTTHYKVTKAQFYSKCRLKEIVQARQAYAYVLYYKFKYSEAQIALELHQKCSNVNIAKKRVQGYMHMDKKFKKLIDYFWDNSDYI